MASVGCLRQTASFLKGGFNLQMQQLDTKKLAEFHFDQLYYVKNNHYLRTYALLFTKT